MMKQTNLTLYHYRHAPTGAGIIPVSTFITPPNKIQVVSIFYSTVILGYTSLLRVLKGGTSYKESNK
ncbi:MAG TPA: hypothetical protein VFV46_04680 [Lacibacter sp.]|nr:hypothetical protein [Lacibacter sp.]